MLKAIIGDLIHASGKNNDIEFWSTYSGITSESSLDHIDKVLTTLGYTGEPKDKLRRWFESIGDGVNKPYDSSYNLFSQADYLAATMTNLLAVAVYDDDGDPIYEEA